MSDNVTSSVAELMERVNRLSRVVGSLLDQLEIAQKAEDQARKELLSATNNR